MTNYNISIIIPTYNSAVTLERCLNSVFQQSMKPKEIIVVDDGSTDNTPEVLHEFNDESIKIIEQNNNGPASARNRGLEIAAGKYIAFLDADDYWLPEFLEKTITFLEEHTDAIAVSVGQIHKIIGKKPRIHPKLLIENNKEAYITEDFFDFWAENNHICTGSVTMRKDIVKQTGGQRPELRVCEDLEFWAYLATFGRWGFIPEVLFVSDGAHTTKKQGWLKKNKIRWASAPTIEQWQKRILPRLTKEDTKGFEKIRSQIAYTLSYSMIISGRDELAYNSFIKYCTNCRQTIFVKILSFASSKGVLTRKLVCNIFRFREYLRAIYIWASGILCRSDCTSTDMNYDIKSL